MLSPPTKASIAEKGTEKDARGTPRDFACAIRSGEKCSTDLMRKIEANKILPSKKTYELNKFSFFDLFIKNFPFCKKLPCCCNVILLFESRGVVVIFYKKGEAFKILKSKPAVQKKKELSGDYVL